MRPHPLAPGPGQESVWDYPRPPSVERVPARLRVILCEQVIAETERGYRVLETSHPPSYYFPPGDVAPGTLVPAGGGSFCEWKGAALHFDVRAKGHLIRKAAWAYPRPTVPFAALAGYVAFYSAPMDVCFVGEDAVTPQPGGFYGGWITPDVVGPFKGEPGTSGW